MTDPTIGSFDDQFMIALELDVAAPVVGDCEPRPDAEREASEGQRRAERGRPNRKRDKTIVEHRQGNPRDEETGGDEQRNDMREPRGPAFGLSRLFHVAGHDVPDG
jgi:hypothetical protein